MMNMNHLYKYVQQLSNLIVIEQYEELIYDDFGLLLFLVDIIDTCIFFFL